MNKEKCPHCKRKWGGTECDICGFADDKNDLRGTTLCPQCTTNTIPEWLVEDHGKCIECWHKENKNVN